MDRFKQINPEDKNTNGTWKLPILYSEGATGKTKQWQVGFDGEGQLLMQFGQVGGAIRITKAEVVPKVNRTMQEQALQEALHRFDEKKRKDAYKESQEEAEDPDEDEEKTLEGFTKPMLAATWDPNKTKIKYPVWTQAKLDGIRALTFNEGGNIRFRSRNGKEFFHLNHLRKELVDLMSYLPKDSILDGEFYSLGLHFNNIASAVKQKSKASPLEKDIIYAIFDIILPNNPPFDQRYELLEKAFDAYDANYKGTAANPLHLIGVAVAESADELYEHHDSYVQDGFEGLIIRKIGGPNPTPADIKASEYKFGRGSNLLKYKEFTDEEAQIIDVKEASGTEKGAAVLIVKDKRGNTLPVRPKGSVEMRREWFDNPKLVIGKQLTIRYQELTPDGIPRFPVGVAIRDYE